MSDGDRLTLKMRPRCRVGCYDWEQEFPREMSIELTLWVDCREAGESDELAAAFNYEPLGRRLLEYCEGTSFKLLEALAEGVAKICLTEFAQPRVRVKATKHESLPAMDAVVIEIERRAGK